MRRILILVAVSMATSSAAQDLQYSDAPSAICLDQSDTAATQRGCIGLSASACIDATESGSTTIGMMECLDGERDFWDIRLNRAYGQLRADMKVFDAEMTENGSSAPKVAPALRDMQRAWITYRDTHCDFELSQWGGGSGGGPAVLSCLLQMTGEQALYLEHAGIGE